MNFIASNKFFNLIVGTNQNVTIAKKYFEYVNPLFTLQVFKDYFVVTFPDMIITGRNDKITTNCPDISSEEAVILLNSKSNSQLKWVFGQRLVFPIGDDYYFTNTCGNIYTSNSEGKEGEGGSLTISSPYHTGYFGTFYIKGGDFSYTVKEIGNFSIIWNYYTISSYSSPTNTISSRMEYRNKIPAHLEIIITQREQWSRGTKTMFQKSFPIVNDNVIIGKSSFPILCNSADDLVNLSTLVVRIDGFRGETIHYPHYDPRFDKTELEKHEAKGYEQHSH